MYVYLAKKSMIYKILIREIITKSQCSYLKEMQQSQPFKK